MTAHRRTRKESLEITSFRFSISCPVPEIFAIKVRSGRNLPKFCMFWPPFWKGSAPIPRIFGLNLSNRTSFRCGKVSRRSVDGPRREPGERKKHHEQNRRPPPPVLTYGRPNNTREIKLEHYLTISNDRYHSLNYFTQNMSATKSSYCKSLITQISLQKYSALAVDTRPPASKDYRASRSNFFGPYGPLFGVLLAFTRWQLLLRY